MANDDLITRLLRGLTAALFLLAFVASPLHAAIPSAGDGHQHMLPHEHSHGHDGVRGEPHGEESPPASDDGAPGAADHSHPATPATPVRSGMDRPALLSDVLRREISPSPGRVSALLKRLNRPPNRSTISA